MSKIGLVLTQGNNMHINFGPNGVPNGYDPSQYGPQSYTIPTVLVRENGKERVMDIDSCLVKERIVSIDTAVNPLSMAIATKTLMFLDTVSNEPIQLLINSPGGSVHDGLRLFDTMQYIKSPVFTVGSGMQASMGAFLLCGGEPGHRYVTPSTSVMFHMVSAGQQGHVKDMEKSFEHTKHLNKVLLETIAKNCGKTYEEVCKDFDRDFWLTAQEAVEYGAADHVITSREEVK